MRASRALLAAAFVAFGGACRTAAPPTLAAGDALDLLHVQELSSKTGQPESSGCETPGATCAVDVTSTLLVRPDVAPLAARLGGSKGVPLPDAGTLGDRRAKLTAALSALNESLVKSKELVATHRAWTAPGAAAPSESEKNRIGQKSAEFEAERRKLHAALAAYVGADPKRFRPNAAPDDDPLEILSDQVDLGLGLPSAKAKTPLGAWLRSELEATGREGESRASAVKDVTSSLSVRLAAFRVHGGKRQQVHLPGYDDLEAGTPRSFSRISTTLTAAEAQELKDGFAFSSEVAQKLRDARDALSQIRGNANQLRDDLKAGLAAAQAELDALRPAVEQDLRTALGELETSVAALPGSAALKSVAASVKTTAQKLAADAEAVRAAVQRVRSLLNAAGAGTSSETAVPQLFSDLSAAAEAVRQGVNDVKSAVQDLPKLKQDLDQALAALSAAAGSDALKNAVRAAVEKLGSLLSATLQPALQRIEASLGPTGKLVGAAEKILALVKQQLPTAKDATDVVQTVLGSKDVFVVPANDALPTKLPILTTDASPGDLLEFVLLVTRSSTAGADADAPAAATRPLHEERRYVSVACFGICSGVSSGVVFVKAKDPALANFEPAPTAVWGLQFTGRPTLRGLSRFVGGVLKPRLGVHAATLDFANASAVEIGVGGALHLFDDLVQIGYGWNLSVAEKRPYWYLGLGLFDLVQGLASKRAAAPAGGSAATPP